MSFFKFSKTKFCVQLIPDINKDMSESLSSVYKVFVFVYMQVVG